jgi:hypothetical protein
MSSFIDASYNTPCHHRRTLVYAATLYRPALLRKALRGNKSIAALIRKAARSLCTIIIFGNNTTTRFGLSPFECGLGAFDQSQVEATQAPALP